MAIHDGVLEDVPVNISKYRENWSAKYQDSMRKAVLQNSDTETLGLICELSGVDPDTTTSLFGDILRKRKSASVIFAINRFVSQRKLSVRSLGNARGDTVTDGTEFRYVLKQIADGDEDFVYKVAIYNEWAEMSDIYTYEAQEGFPQNYLDAFKDEMRSLLHLLRRKTQSSHYGHDERDKIEYESGALFNINRQTSDQARRDVSGRQRRRNLANLFIEFDDSQNQIRIGTTNTNIRETVRNKIQDVLGIYLIDLETNVTRDQVREDQFSSELTADIEDPEKTRILAAEFNRTNVSPSSPLKISKKTYGRDVRPIIRSLDPDIVSVDLDNVSKLWIELDGEQGTININQSPQESFIRLSSNVDTKLDRNREKFRNLFHDTFGVPPDKKIPLHWVTGDRRSFISAILKNPSSYDSRKYPNQELIREIADLGVVNLKEVTPKRCVDCGNRYNRHISDCPSCGGDLDQIARYEVPRISKPGVREFIKDILAEEGVEYLGKRTERIFKTEYEFLRIQGEKRQVDLHLNTDDVNLTENAVEHLQKSLNPVVVVNPGEVKNKTLMDEALTASVDLAELIDYRLDGELPSDYISREIQRVERTVEERAARNARSAYDTIRELVQSPDSSNASRFEEELFHIFNQIISNTQQWGNKRSGKNVPDGFAELYFETGQGSHHNAFTYDSKFTEKSDVSLDTDETKRLRDYVHRIIESEEIKSSDTSLSHFVIITNAGPDGMDTVAGRLNRMRKWDGYPVYIHSSFPLALHLAYNENAELIQANRNQFSKELYCTLNGGRLYQTDQDEEFFVHLNGDDVEELMTSFEEEISESGLDITELREFLELDVFP